MSKDKKQKQADNPANEIAFEEILEGFLKVKPPEKKKPVKKKKSKPKK